VTGVLWADCVELLCVEELVDGVFPLGAEVGDCACEVVEMASREMLKYADVNPFAPVADSE
jgi:hypothetical protein